MTLRNLNMFEMHSILIAKYTALVEQELTTELPTLYRHTEETTVIINISAAREAGSTTASHRIYEGPSGLTNSLQLTCL